MFHKTYMLHSQSPCLAHQIFNIRLIRDWNRKVYLSKMPPQGGRGSPVSSNPSQCTFSPGVFSPEGKGAGKRGGWGGAQVSTPLPGWTLKFRPSPSVHRVSTGGAVSLGVTQAGVQGQLPATCALTAQISLVLTTGRKTDKSVFSAPPPTWHQN